tara:strand:- start:565 stop:1458 length:894 start_codon:yes stop_codon:yes gene_type:complete
MNNEVLVIMMGSSRGGKHALETQKKFFLDYLNADLAICFGDVDKTSAEILEIAKYNWNFIDFENWRDYFEQNFSSNIVDNFIAGGENGLAGGIDNHTGSGSIIFAIRDILKRNYLDIIKSYKQVILTRSDYLYVDFHPQLDFEKISVIEGEDYFGITDRHYVFPGKYAEEILGVCDYLDIKDVYKEWHEIKNPESVLMFYYKKINLYNNIERFKRTQLVVKQSGDSTRWGNGIRLLFFRDLDAKKVSEFENTMKNLKLLKRFNLINFKLKINYYLFQIRKLINNVSFKIFKKRIFVQ